MKELSQSQTLFLKLDDKWKIANSLIVCHNKITVMHIGKIRVMIDRVTSRSKVVSEHSLSLSFCSGLSFSAVSVFDSALTLQK